MRNPNRFYKGMATAAVVTSLLAACGEMQGPSDDSPRPPVKEAKLNDADKVAVSMAWVAAAILKSANEQSEAGHATDYGVKVKGDGSGTLSDTQSQKGLDINVDRVGNGK